jgi:tetratricopeptide (TPR) repeat protein
MAAPRPVRLSLRSWLLLLSGLVALVVGYADVLDPARAFRVGGTMPSSEVCPYPFQVHKPGSVDPEIRFYLARVERAPNIAPDQALLAAAYLRQARISMEPAWFLLAEKAARLSLSYQPLANSGALLVLARVAEARHEFDEALRLSEAAGSATRSPEWRSLRVTVLLAQGRVEQAEREVEALVATRRDQASLTSRALVRQARGRDMEAYTDLREAMSREQAGEPLQASWCRAVLGRWLLRSGRLTVAEAVLDEALRVVPDYPFALMLRAELRGRRGQPAAALADFLRVFERAGLPAALVAAARLVESNGDRAQAQRLRARAHQALEGNVGAGSTGHQRDLATLLLDEGREGAPQRALKLMQAEVVRRRDAETLEVLARALLACGKAAQARTVLQEELARGTRSAAAHARLAEAERALGDVEASNREQALARSIDPLFER